MTDPRDYRLRLGEVVIGLRCPDAALAANLARYFDRPGDPAEPDIRLDLHLVPHADRPDVPNSLILNKTVAGGAFDIAGGLIRGRYDPASGDGELHVKAILTQGLMTRVLEQVFYQAFHSAARRAGYDACLLHSAGVIADGRGYVFVGPSEAGKTTAARLSADHTVVNDEMNLVEFHPDGLRLVGTPFNGHFRDKRPGAAPLRAVLLLAKAVDHALATVGPGEAAAAVATQVAPPVGLDEIPDDDTPQTMLDLGSRIVTAVAVRRLHFRPDAGFWPLITANLGDDPRG
jgi:hypothetical protein